MASKDTNTGAKRARELRAELAEHADPAQPLDCLLTVVEEVLEIPVAIVALPDEICGCCRIAPNGKALLWINGTHPAARQRFTLAHELGHLRCGHDASIPVESFVTLSGKSTDGREVQANAFAAELLAPRDYVAALSLADPGVDEVLALSAATGLSTISALFRFNSMGIAARYDELKAELNAEYEADPRSCEERDNAAFIDGLSTQLASSTLPRFSSALEQTALGALAASSADVHACASAAGCDPSRLALAASTIGI